MAFAWLKNWGRPQRDLLSFLLESASPSAPLDERIDWLERVLQWIRTAPLAAHGFDPSSGALHNARLRFLLQLLDRNEGWRRSVGRTLATIIRDTYAFRLLSQAGLGRDRGLLVEASERFIRRVLPRPMSGGDLADVFQSVFDSESDAGWVETLSDDTAERLIALVRDAGGVDVGTRARWREEIASALTALGARVATLGTSTELLLRLSPYCRENPYLALNVALGGFAQKGISEAAAAAAIETVERCRLATAAIFEELETSGASVSLVYTLDTIQSSVDRIRLLLDVLRVEGRARLPVYRMLAARLVRQSVEQRRLRALFQANVRLVARKITERTGQSGEHYIARSRPEYFAMIRAGMGGGIVMVFATLNKVLIHRLHLALFPEFCLFSANYVGGFLLLQKLGFTLATKQPSATAAALAAKLESLEEEGEIRAFVDEACRMARTQVAALIGNLLALVPVAVVVGLSFRRFFGRNLLSVTGAQAVLDSLHPLRSFTLANAVLTGVLLWLSSLAAGWLENSIVYRRIPLALASHPRLRRALGPKRAEALGNFVLRNATLLGGNVSLGVMMGAVSILGPFLGLPLDVRHVTLSAASLTFAATVLTAAGVSWTLFVAPAIGVLMVGALNFAVAYALAFIVAARSRDLSSGSERRLLRALRTRLRHRPLDFLIPRERAT